MITKPKFVIFDYGNTLVEEEVVFDSSTFTRVYDTITENPNNISQEKLYDEFINLENQVHADYHDKDLEYRYEDIFRYLFTYLGLRSNQDYETLSEYYFDDYAPGKEMYGAKEVLAYLDEKNIPTGVISNLSYSSNILERRLNRILGHDFEFVLTTCEWMYKKPNRSIFDIGRSLVGEDPHDIWYVGDNPLNDVIGAARAGMVPVYFNTKTENVFLRHYEDVDIGEDHLIIDELPEIIDIIEEL